MKTITELTDQDCIHCRTQEEWDGILAIWNPLELTSREWQIFGKDSIILKDGKFGNTGDAEYLKTTIHPASDFLTPTVSVLTEIGEYKVIKHKGGCIVIKDDKAMTLTEDIVNWIKEMK